LCGIHHYLCGNSECQILNFGTYMILVKKFNASRICANVIFLFCNFQNLHLLNLCTSCQWLLEALTETLLKHFSFFLSFFIKAWNLRPRFSTLANLPASLDFSCSAFETTLSNNGLERLKMWKARLPYNLSTKTHWEGNRISKDASSKKKKKNFIKNYTENYLWCIALLKKILKT
jgi:hypothetical protein